MAPQDPFQPPPLYGQKFVGEAQQLATKCQIDPSVDPRPEIDAYLASIKEYAAAVASDKDRLLPYVAGQLRLILIPFEAGASQEDAGRKRFTAVIRTLVDHLGRNA